jgi:hypothetical protein
VMTVNIIVFCDVTLYILVDRILKTETARSSETHAPIFQTTGTTPQKTVYFSSFV